MSVSCSTWVLGASTGGAIQAVKPSTARTAVSERDVLPGKLIKSSSYRERNPERVPFASRDESRRAKPADSHAIGAVHPRSEAPSDTSFRAITANDDPVSRPADVVGKCRRGEGVQKGRGLATSAPCHPSCQSRSQLGWRRVAEIRVFLDMSRTTSVAL